MQNFALIGAAGFIAPRHLKAIRETGNNLVAALDPFDSVGILDSYFPNCSFFTEFERFDRHVERLKETPDRIGYLSICSPNYLHDAHVRFGLRIGADVICEKPLVLNPWNIDALEHLESETGRHVYNIFQLRLHPAIVALKKRVEASDPEGEKQGNGETEKRETRNAEPGIRKGETERGRGGDRSLSGVVPERSRRVEGGANATRNTEPETRNPSNISPSTSSGTGNISNPSNSSSANPEPETRNPKPGTSDKIFDIDLTYITSRGNWYYTSWKGDVSKSGGVATNIGVHFYDMLAWVFGEVEENVMHISSHDRVSGFLRFKKARVRYFLSINEDTLPDDIKASGKRTFRSMKMDGEEIEFSDGFTDLHTESYRQILEGNGFRLGEARTAINIVHDIRHAQPIGLKGDFHPFAALPFAEHPFRTKQ